MGTYNGNTVKINLSGVGEREYYATGDFSWETKGSTSYTLEVTVGIHKSSDWYNSPLSGSVAATGQTTKTFSGNTNANKSGTTATLKTYTFSWNRGKSDASKTVTVKVSRTYNGTTYTSTLTHSVTIPALASYTVAYNKNATAATGSMSSHTKWYGESLTLRTNTYSRTGYTFSKFNTKSDGSGTSYASGGTYSANAAATMYAQWSPITRTLSYNANGGSGAPASQTKTYDKNLTLSTTKPTRTDWYFRGWGSSASASSPTWQPGGTYSTNITSDTTLYALWYAPRTVNFNANGGSGAPGQKTKVYGTALPLTDTPPTRAGYTFQGWATSATANTVEVAPNGSYTANNSTATADSVTLYAVWKPVLTMTTTATRYSDAAHTVDDDEGTYAVIECAWTSPVAALPTFAISPSIAPDSTSGGTAGTSGTLVIELSDASADLTYTASFSMSVAASNVSGGYQEASASTTAKLLSAVYTLDFKESAHAGILAPALDDYLLNVGNVLQITDNGQFRFGLDYSHDFIFQNNDASKPGITHWRIQMTDYGNLRLDSSADGGETWTTDCYFAKTPVKVTASTSAVTATATNSAAVTANSNFTVDVTVASPSGKKLIAVVAVKISGTGTGVVTSRGFDADGLATGGSNTVHTYWRSTGAISANAATVTVQILTLQESLS